MNGDSRRRDGAPRANHPGTTCPRTRTRADRGKGGYRECCGAKDFGVGDALYLGFLFLDEDHYAYMVALTCRNPGCAKPRTEIVLPEKDFLS